MSTPLTLPRRMVLTTDAVGGIWTYTLDLARALTKAGVKVELVVLGPPPALHQQHEAAAVDGVHLTMLDLPLDWLAPSEAALREASRTLFALLRTMAPVLFQLNSPGLAAEAAGGIPLVTGLHSCVASWWRAVRPLEELPDDLAWRAWEIGRGLRHADAVIVPSKSFAGTVREIYGRSTAIEAIHNGRTWQRVPGAEHDPRTVLTAGRLWDDAKNIGVLDRAAALSPIPVHAAGPLADPQTGAAPHRFDNLHLLGNLSAFEMRGWLERAGIFVSPAVYEPFGLGVLEAAQSGCALVLAENPTFRELWDGAALFVDPHDPAAFAAAIEDLAGAPRLCAELGEKACRRAGRYSLSDMAASTMSLYSRVLEAEIPAEGAVA